MTDFTETNVTTGQASMSIKDLDAMTAELFKLTEEKNNLLKENQRFRKALKMAEWTAFILLALLCLLLLVIGLTN